MAPMKAKTVATAGTGKFAVGVRKSLAALKRPAAAASEQDHESAEVQEGEADVYMKKPASFGTALKRPASAATGGPASKRKRESTKAAEEELIEERTKELKAMLVADLKDLVKSKGLETGLKSDMIETILASEAAAREKARAHEAKVQEVIAQIKTDIAEKPRPDLAELCGSKGLKKGGAKNELVERLVDKAKEDGEVEKMLANKERDSRRDQLLSLGKDELSKLCNKHSIDPLVKEIMVDRILSAEMPGSVKP